MRKTFLFGSMVLALAGCKKDKAKAGDKAAPEVAAATGEAKPAATPVKPAEPPPPPRHKGVEPMPMPPPIELTPEEHAQVADLATKGWSGVVQYGVPRGGFPDEVDAILRANPKLLIALAQSDNREVQIVAGQELFDLQVWGDPILVPPQEWKPVALALMTSKDQAVAASVTQSASIGPRDDKADPDIQAMFQRQCLDDTRPLVRGAACAGVVAQLNLAFMKHPAAQEVAAKALTDDSDYVVMRTLEMIANLSLEAKYQDRLLPLLAHKQPAIRGLAASIVDRNFYSDGNLDAAAVPRGHDALVGLLKDPEPFVRCKALYGLRGWDFRDRWQSVEASLPLLDDTAKPASKLAYKSEWLEGPKDDEWSMYVSGESVSECAVRALVSKAGSAPTSPLQFTEWDTITTTGRKAFVDWWEASKAALLAPKQM